MTPAEESVRRSTRILTAFMSPLEAQGFAGQTLDPAAFLANWQSQLGRVTSLPQTYSPARVEDLSPTGQAHVAQIQATQAFRNIYGPQADFKMVELGKLIACQWNVDTVVSDGVHGASLSATPTEDEILNKCLPLTIVGAAQTLWQVMPRGGPTNNPRAGVVVSSTDLTFDVAPGFPQANHTTGQIGIILSAGANLMLVRQCGDRLVLANGYHRAAMLRSRGVDMAPMVIVPVPSTAALVNGPGFFQEPLLISTRPPLVDDFRDDALATTTDVRAMMKVVRVTVESLLVPRMI